ncbi:MAG: hypothetical protein QOI26_252, partial [Pseudonocardiales bacterium]|nr:hypothetical protein [Pseudonocardiales bacterium]
VLNNRSSQPPRWSPGLPQVIGKVRDKTSVCSLAFRAPAGDGAVHRWSDGQGISVCMRFVG